jgi:hypothetical protein
MTIRLNRCSTILALAVAILALNPGRAYAQEPPTYDFDAGTAGVQGPTSPLLANPFTRFFRPLTVIVPLLVPAADLQAALPPGFNALPDNLGRASINAIFSFQVTDAEHAPVTPYHTLVLLTLARNTSLNRVESLLLARFNSSQEAVDAENLTTGGGAWRADFEWAVGQTSSGELDIHVEIDAGDVGLALRVTATGSARFDERVVFDPNVTPFRYINAGVALGSFRVGSMFDRRVVPSTKKNLKVHANGGRLELPGGASLLLLDVGPVFIFQKSQEVWLAFE